MIPSNEIDKAGASFLSKTYYEITTKDTCFKAGVKFTEEYLKDLSCEFAEWIDKSRYIRAIKLEKFVWLDTWKAENYTTQELFQLFTEEKYKTKNSEK